MTWIKVWICVALLGTFLAVQAKDSWKWQGIGNVKFTHYLYEGEELKGIAIASEEGVIAVLDHKTGEIKWRDYNIAGRKLQRFLAEGHCKITLSF
jgi:hypothetical protein